MVDRPLHIAIDGRELAGRPTGVGRYLLEILKQWAATPSAHRFTLVMPSQPPAALTTLGSQFTWHVVPDPVGGTWWEQVHLRRALQRERPDVLFAPGYTAPIWSPCPVVLTVHDVSFCAHPEWFGPREGLRRRWLTRLAARRARTVVTVSQFSSREIQRYLSVPASRIVVATHGAPDVGQPQADTASRIVLFVGSLFNRRHLPEMIGAFAVAAATVPDARLVIVGDNRTSPPIDPRQMAADLRVGDRVDWREYVDDAELDRLYRSARVFVFLSDYEGFAMTPLEALAHGVPSVLQDTEVAREIYGPAAVLVPPVPAAIATALGRLLTDDAAHQAQLAAGRARLSSFSWDRSAALVMQALEKAAR